MRDRAADDRLSALERRVPTGPLQVSVFQGATATPVRQVGFPVKTTGAYDTATGYPWAQLVLDPATTGGPVKDAGSLQLTGKYAYAPDHDTSLATGTKGWLEPDPQGRGFLFVVAGGGSAAVDALAWKASVRVATTAAVTLSSLTAGAAVDGATLVAGDRVLVKDQVFPNGPENGIYDIQASGSPVRSADSDASGKLLGAAVYVREGTVNATRTYWQTTSPFVLGTNSANWAQAPSATTTRAGYVDLGDQEWVGKKTFDNMIVAQAGNTAIGAPDYASIQAYNDGPYDASDAASTAAIVVTSVYPSSGGCRIRGAADALRAAPCVQFSFGGNIAVDIGYQLAFGGTWLRANRFVAGDAFTEYPGASGTDALGNVFTGGINTTVGSGTIDGGGP